MDEKIKRFEIFIDNLKYIDETNKKKSSYWLGLNQFADVSPQEFKTTYLGSRSGAFEGTSSFEKSYENVLFQDPPDSVDWRQKGAVTPVKDQGLCGTLTGSKLGSSWAFSAIAGVEGVYQIATGRLVSLSEQELIDCDTSSNGCIDGGRGNAFAYMRNHGIHSERQYPFVGEKGTCNASEVGDPVARLSGFKTVTADDEESFLGALAGRPVTVVVDASSRDFLFYKGGVFFGPCGTGKNHDAIAVGYGTAGLLDYIIVKNSWGTKWGENGYMRVRRNTGIAQGLCGIYQVPLYPILRNTTPESFATASA